MCRFMAPVLCCLLCFTTWPARAAETVTFNWQVWEDLVTEDGGRCKPLDSSARETLRELTNRQSLHDPDTGRRLDPVPLYLTLLFDWQGWDQPQAGVTPSKEYNADNYYGLHQGDKWDRTPLIPVDNPELRSALKIEKHARFVAPHDLNQAVIEVPWTHEERPFLLWAEGLSRRAAHELDAYERRALELANRYWSYQQHRMGRRLHAIPVRRGQDQPWMTVAELVRVKFDDQSDPAGKLRAAQSLWGRLRTAFRDGSADEFNQASAAWLATVREVAHEGGVELTPATMRLEVWYNHCAPFRVAAICMLFACTSLLINRCSGRKSFLLSGWSLYLCGLAAILVGFAVRITIAGRGPVTNMYESVICVALSAALLGACLAIVSRQRLVLVAAAGLAALALAVADRCPTALDPTLQPLPPILGSDFWLVAHVLPITLSYAAFALALGIGNMTLGHFLCGSENVTAVESLSVSAYRAIQGGLFLLTVGAMLGSTWADLSWGRCWGWDPKEVWTLITLLGYLAVLRARQTGWVKPFGFAVLSVVSFSLVIMTWYGVNFVLSAGRHRYGFGTGGAASALMAIVVQAAYVIVAGVRHALVQRAVREQQRLSAGPTLSRLASSPTAVPAAFR